MQKNKWIADRGYGTGMAIAFQGDENFIRRSVNFAANFLLTPRSQIKQHTPSFVIINTTQEDLVKAFELEGYTLKMQELWKNIPTVQIDEDDLPADFEERVREYTLKVLTGDPTAVDPVANMYPEETPAMVKEATAYSKKYAQDRLAEIESEDFMRRISRAGLQEHAFTEKAS